MRGVPSGPPCPPPRFTAGPRERTDPLIKWAGYIDSDADASASCVAYSSAPDDPWVACTDVEEEDGVAWDTALMAAP